MYHWQIEKNMAKRLFHNISDIYIHIIYAYLSKKGSKVRNVAHKCYHTSMSMQALKLQMVEETSKLEEVNKQLQATLTAEISELQRKLHYAESEVSSGWFCIALY